MLSWAYRRRHVQSNGKFSDEPVYSKQYVVEKSIAKDLCAKGALAINIERIFYRDFWCNSAIIQENILSKKCRESSKRSATNPGYFKINRETATVTVDG